MRRGDFSRPQWFQSLLYWNTSENQDVFGNRRHVGLSFQSLLYWNTSENVRMYPHIAHAVMVSILVVLEYL